MVFDFFLFCLFYTTLHHLAVVLIGEKKELIIWFIE